MVNMNVTSATVASSPVLTPELSSNLTKLSLVKQQLGINISDTKWDCTLDGLITAVSVLVEQECNRRFKKSTQIEFHESTQQMPRGIGGIISFEIPDYIWFEQPPIDQTQSVVLQYSFNRDWDNTENMILNEDFYIERLNTTLSQSEVIKVFPQKNLLIRLADVPIGVFTHFNVIPHIMGYRLQYTGGFDFIPKSTELDIDGNYINVPFGLQVIVANKVARFFKNKMEGALFLDENEKKALKAYKRQGKFLGS